MIELAKQSDYECYLASGVLAPAERQRAHLLLALRAELMKAPKQASEPHLIMIRLKWWEEAMAEVLSGKPHSQNQPMLCALADTDFTAKTLQPLIDARMIEAEVNKGTASRTDFDHYLRNDLLHLIQLITGEPADETAEAFAYMQLLRRLPQQLEQIIWPLDVMHQCGILPIATRLGTEEVALKQFVTFWIEEIESRLTSGQPSHPFTRQLHRITRHYAKALRKRDLQLSKLPPRLWWLPIALLSGR